MRLKNKSILIDYLNLYTFFYIVFKNYKYVQILYKNQILSNLYSNVLSRIGVTIVFKNITYSSSDSQNYVDIEKEKEFLTSKYYVNNNILANYLYKLYYYQRIHPVVEFFMNCSIINSVNELLTCVKQLDLNSLQIDRGSAIDPFVDGRAQNRITEYIQLLLSSNENSKSSMIRSSNSIYKKRYGNDKVFEKEHF